MKSQKVSKKKIEQIINDPYCQLSFATKEEETRYEKQDWALNQLIKCVFEGKAATDRDFHQTDDWYPNQLRGVEVAQSIFSDDLASELQSLLQHEFASFRIVLHVYDDIFDGATHRSTVLITSTGFFVWEGN